jgi:hypothetical protein
MPWNVIIPAVGAIGGALIGGKSQSKATRAQVEAGEAGIAETARQFDLTRSDLAPFLETGTQASQKLRDVLLGGTALDAPSLPGYEQYKKAGLEAAEGSAFGRGQGLSGRTLASLYNQGQAFDYGASSDYLNRLQSLSGAGQTAGTHIGAFGAQKAGRISDLLTGQGEARASGAKAQGKNLTDLFQNLGTTVLSNI